MNQQTLKNTYTFEGRGLHTGRPVRARLCPAPADTGVVFVRTDLGGLKVPALASNVRSTRRSTQLAAGRAKVGTVEHVLSALTGLGVDNAFVELDNAEMPILDGSARRYAEAIAADGTVDQGVPRRWVELKKEIIVRNEKKGAWIKATPAGEPGIELTIDFPSKVLGKQTVFLVKGDSYLKNIAPCRTFCFYKEIEPMLKAGLIKGGDLSNALVVTDDGYQGNPVLHFQDECGRHKLLDMLGDFRLSGGYLNARISAFKTGHPLNTKAAKALRALLK